MSYTALIIFEEGKPKRSVEYRNAWGGSARIWTSLFDAYVPKKDQFDSWLANNGNDRRLWDLAKREDLPIFERAVHAFTFDRFYVRREYFDRFANDLLLFAKNHPVIGVDHLPDWAKWLKLNGNNIEAVGLHGTSVSENPWYRCATCPHCGGKMDNMEPIPLTEGTEVYDWLTKPNGESQ